jgi:hypothetical protein
VIFSNKYLIYSIYKSIFNVYESDRRLIKQDLKIGDKYFVNYEKSILTDVNNSENSYTFKNEKGDVTKLYYHNLNMDFELYYGNKVSVSKLIFRESRTFPYELSLGNFKLTPKGNIGEHTSLMD